MLKNSLVPPERGDVNLLTGGLLSKEAQLFGEGVVQQEGQLVGEGVVLQEGRSVEVVIAFTISAYLFDIVNVIK